MWVLGARLSFGMGPCSPGYLLCVCSAEGFQLPGNHPDQNFKGCSVSRDDSIVNRNWEVVVRHDLGPIPATLEAARVCNAFGCSPGHAMQIADAPAAYDQANLKGISCWIHLPPALDHRTPPNCQSFSV